MSPATALRRAPELGDDELFEAFHEGTLSPEGFDHRQHVRLAWVCLRRRPLSRVLEGFRGGLERLADHAGQPGLYHQTITWTYLLLVAEAMERSGREATWEDFTAAHPKLLAPPKELLASYYRPETLNSGLARRSFVFPDRGTTSILNL